MMNSREIVQFGHPVLRSTAAEVLEFNSALQELSQQMQFIVDDIPALGLAAPQLTVPKQVLVARLNNEQLQTFVNPKIINYGSEQDIVEETCLSLPQEISLEIQRSTEITLQAQDLNGRILEYEASGREARVLQHEVDHLQGKLIFDRLDKAQRRQALKKIRNIMLGSWSEWLKLFSSLCRWSQGIKERLAQVLEIARSQSFN